MTPERNAVRLIAGLVAGAIFSGLAVWASMGNLPYVTERPGDTLNVLGTNGSKEIITVKGAKAYHDDGGLRMVTVYVTAPAARLNTWEVLEAWQRDDIALLPRWLIYGEETADQSQKASALQMSTSQETAIAVALRATGRTVCGKQVVSQVSKDLPAAGTLKQGDVINSINGQVPCTTTDVVDQVRAIPQGGTAVIDYTRKGKHHTVRLTPVTVDGVQRVGVIPTIDYDRFPVNVTINVPSEIGGPSAGLIFSLAVYDTLTKGSLTGGHDVAGTGEIYDNGAVGPIGGIVQKVSTARADGAKLFLVPVDNCDEVGNADPGDMRLAVVATFDDALNAINDWVANPETDLPTCEDFGR